MSPAILEWLKCDREAEDYYELVGTARLEPSRERLLTLIRSSLRQLLDAQSVSASAQRGVMLQRELAKAELTFGDVTRQREYEARVMTAIGEAYRRRVARQDPIEGQALRDWLRRTMLVHDARLDEVMRHICGLVQDTCDGDGLETKAPNPVASASVFGKGDGDTPARAAPPQREEGSPVVLPVVYPGGTPRPMIAIQALDSSERPRRMNHPGNHRRSNEQWAWPYLVAFGAAVLLLLILANVLLLVSKSPEHAGSQAAGPREFDTGNRSAKGPAGRTTRETTSRSTDSTQPGSRKTAPPIAADPPAQGNAANKTIPYAAQGELVEILANFTNVPQVHLLLSIQDPSGASSRVEVYAEGGQILDALADYVSRVEALDMRPAPETPRGDLVELIGEIEPVVPAGIGYWYSTGGTPLVRLKEISRPDVKGSLVAANGTREGAVAHRHGQLAPSFVRILRELPDAAADVKFAASFQRPFKDDVDEGILMGVQGSPRSVVVVLANEAQQELKPGATYEVSAQGTGRGKIQPAEDGRVLWPVVNQASLVLIRPEDSDPTEPP